MCDSPTVFATRDCQRICVHEAAGFFEDLRDDVLPGRDVFRYWFERRYFGEALVIAFDERYKHGLEVGKEVVGRACCNVSSGDHVIEPKLMCAVFLDQRNGCVQDAVDFFLPPRLSRFALGHDGIHCCSLELQAFPGHRATSFKSRAKAVVGSIA